VVLVSIITTHAHHAKILVLSNIISSGRCVSKGAHICNITKILRIGHAIVANLSARFASMQETIASSVTKALSSLAVNALIHVPRKVTLQLSELASHVIQLVKNVLEL
jgi:hypothetical protein